MSFSADPNEQRRAYDLALRCIRNVPYGQWVKAGTIGTYVSTALGNVGGYNKPAIKLLLAKNPGNGTIYRVDPVLGYQPMQVDDRAPVRVDEPTRNGVEESSQNTGTRPQPVGSGRPQVQPGSSSTISVVSVVRDMVFCSDGSVTTLAVPGCNHRVIDTTFPAAPSCLMCGIRFCATKQLSELFSHPSVMEAVSSAFSNVKI